VGRVKVVVHRVYEAVEVEDVNEKDPFNVGNRTCVPPVSETESEEPVQTEENVSIPWYPPDLSLITVWVEVLMLYYCICYELDMVDEAKHVYNDQRSMDVPVIVSIKYTS